MDHLSTFKVVGRRGKSFEVPCACCGKPVVLELGVAKRRSARRFCSPACYHASRRVGVVRGADAAIRLAWSKGYRANEDGSVVGPSGERINLYPGNTDGRYLHFSVKGARSAIAVHRFVAFQKFGEEALAAQCVRHKNDVGTDNRADNILIGTFQQNAMDVPEAKRRSRNLKHTRGTRRFSDKAVKEIRRRLATGETYTGIGRSVGCAAATIRGIALGLYYADVSKE
jgi:hypothetical protein